MNDILDKRLVLLHADVATSEEAITLMSERLEELGYVRSGYAEMVIQREKEFPTGLPGKSMCIAIPHTDPTLIEHPAIGVVVPKQPVSFDLMGERGTSLEVELILPLVIKSPGQQIELLKAIMGLIQDGELLKAIRDAADESEVVALLDRLRGAAQIN